MVVVTHVWVAGRAATAAARPEPPGAADVARRLADVSPDVRREAWDAISQRVCSDRLNVLNAAALGETEDRGVRLELLQRIGNTADRAAAPATYAAVARLWPRLSPPQAQDRMQTGALAGGDRELRLAALAAVARVMNYGASGRDALPVVLQAAADPDLRISLAAVRILASYEHLPPEALPPLAEMLRIPDTEVRLVVLKALARSDNTHAVAAPLLAALADPDGEVRGHAIEALGRSRSPQAIAPLARFLGAKPDASMSYESTRANALAAVAALADLARYAPDARRPLAAALADEREQGQEIMRVHAARGLWALGERKRAVDALIALLREQSFGVQAAAADALSGMGADAARALPALIAVAAEEDHRWPHGEPVRGQDSARWAAKGAIKKLGGPAVLEVLSFVRVQDEDRRALAEGLLSELDLPNDSGLVKAVEEKLGHASPHVRAAAAEVLGRMGARAGSAAGALGARLAGDASQDVRQAAADALVKLGPAAAPAKGALEGALRAPSGAVVALAATALGHIGAPARGAGGALKRVIQPAGGGSAQAVAAAWALAATGADAAGGVDALVRMLGDGGTQPSLRAGADVRRDAARALGRLAHVPEAARAVGPLVRAVRDTDQPVAAAAVDALVQLDGAGRTGGRVPVEPLIAILDKGPVYNGPSAAALGRLLAGMGARAAPAVPALVKAFRMGVDLAQPLVTLGRSVPAVAPALRQAFDDDCPGRYGRADPVLAAIAAARP